jgi:hypothetical protein
MNHRVNVVTFHGTEQRRQVTHVRSHHISAVLADNFLEVVAIGRKIEENHFIAGIDSVPRAI